MISYSSSLKLDFKELKKIEAVYRKKFAFFEMSRKEFEAIFQSIKENCYQQYNQNQEIEFKELYESKLKIFYHSYIQEKLKDGTFSKILDNYFLNIIGDQKGYEAEFLITKFFSEIDYNITLEDAATILNNSKYLILFLKEYLNNNDIQSISDKENINTLLKSYVDLFKSNKSFSQPYSKQEQSSYFDRIKEGDKQSKAEFILKNTGLINYIINSIDFDYRFYEDVYQAGLCGLIKAINSFDNKKGYMFSTFAYSTILWEILKEINEIMYDFHVSHRLQSLLTEYKQLEDNLSPEEIATRLSTTVETAHILKRNPNALSLETDIIQEIFNLDESSTEKTPLKDTISYLGNPEEDMIDKVYRQELSKNVKKIFAHSTLDKDKKLIISKYYDLDGNGAGTLSSIGKALGISDETVRIRKNKGLAYLGIEYKNELLPFAQKPKEAKKYILSKRKNCNKNH